MSSDHEKLIPNADISRFMFIEWQNYYQGK